MPSVGVSTVTHSALAPPAATRATSSRLKPRSLCQYSRNQTGAALAATHSSMVAVPAVLSTKTAPTSPAPRAVATSPSGCDMRWKDVGASRIGCGSVSPRRVTPVAMLDMSRRARPEPQAVERGLVVGHRELVAGGSRDELVDGVRHPLASGGLEVREAAEAGGDLRSLLAQAGPSPNRGAASGAGSSAPRRPHPGRCPGRPDPADGPAPPPRPPPGGRGRRPVRR